MAYHRLAVIALEEDSILVAAPMAIVANLALCVELLLKATDAKVNLSPIGRNGPLGPASIGSNVWGHDLADIFSKMDPELQTILAQLFEEGTGKPLRPLLEKCKDYFTHARYYYESKHHHAFDISGIRLLADGLSAALWKGWGPKV